MSRSFLRVRLGERTFGVLTVALVYVFFVSVQASSIIIPRVTDQINEVIGESEREDLITGLAILSADDQVQSNFWTILTIGFVREIENAYHENELSFPVEIKTLWWIIFVMSLMHFVERLRRRQKGEVLHSYHRGKSVFFSFLEGKGLKNVFTIKDIHIWMFIEPAFVLLLSYLTSEFLDAQVLSTLLFISAFVRVCTALGF